MFEDAWFSQKVRVEGAFQRKELNEQWSKNNNLKTYRLALQKLENFDEIRPSD